LAYRADAGEPRQLKWYNRTGKITGSVDEPDGNLLQYPELSPDGQHLAVQRTVQGNLDVWLMDLMRGGITRFTFDQSVDGAPLWSPDGLRIAFTSFRKGSGNLYVKPTNGAGDEELLVENRNFKYAHDWSKDGRFLLYAEGDPKTGRHLWAVPVNGDERKPIPVTKTPFEELNGQFSPDGRWVAYETNESGRFEIVVQPFPSLTGKWQVSTSGGIQPRWSPDGKELYFVSPDNRLMAVSIISGATFAAATPVPLFSVTLPPGTGANKQQYAVLRNDRFLINQPVESYMPKPITLLLNWHPPKP
jgi:Tol biopolymer transport system component